MANYVSRRLAQHLKTLREKSGKKQEEMASIFSIKQQNYSRLEKGKTHFNNKNIDAICETFNISFDEFYHGRQSTPLPAALINYYEFQLLERELEIVRLKLKIRHFIPFQETTGKNTPLIYVMI